MVHGASIHASIHVSYQTWSLPKVIGLYLGGLFIPNESSDKEFAAGKDSAGQMS